MIRLVAVIQSNLRIAAGGWSLWTWPDWMPLIGGDIFFSPVFNFADSCITCGVAVVLLFYTKYVNMGLHYKNPDEED